MEQEFEFIRSNFFPRWDSARRWKAEARSRTESSRESGYCDLNTKTILIAPFLSAAAGPERTTTLIHEICHAVAAPNHGKKWRTRMSVASAKARQIGLADVADKLDWEVEEYASDRAETLTPSVVYRKVGDIVRGLDGKINFEHVVTYIASLYGLTDDELHRRCRRLRRVYDEAVREAEEMAKAQKELTRRWAEEQQGDK